MRVARTYLAVLLLPALLLTACNTPETDEQAATSPSDVMGYALTEEEQAEGWQLLFDGETLDGWRGFQQQEIPDGWTVQEGAIHFPSNRGDINEGLLTEEQFSDFELRFDWKIAPQGNSGVFFHVTGAEDTIWKTGPEYQTVDNVGHADGANPLMAAASNYSLYGPQQNYSRPAGEYNEGRLVVQGDRVEHWLNGQQVVEYELGSEDWQQRVDSSGFSEFASYGRTGSGHIALQEGGPVWYRNIRILRTDSRNE